MARGQGWRTFRDAPVEKVTARCSLIRPGDTESRRVVGPRILLGRCRTNERFKRGVVRKVHTRHRAALTFGFFCKGANDASDVVANVRGAAANVAMTKRRDQLQNADGVVEDPWKFTDWDMMKGQWHTRAKESKDPNNSPALGKTAGELGVPLSPGEVALQQEAAANDKKAAESHNAANPAAPKPVPAGTFNPETDAPKWNSGSKGWLMNERDTWVRRHREMGIPLAAGPSGHTAVLLNVGRYFKQDVYKIRLAAIGNLLPFGHHTLVEVLTAASAFGAAYTPGEKMYTNIKPLGTEELRALGGGRFPHEHAETAKAETPEKKA